MIYENGVLLDETERFPIGDRRSVADVDLDLLRQERMRMGTFDDNRRTHAARTGAFRRIAFALGPPAGDLGLRRALERFPFVPADPTASSRTATRPTTSRSPGCSSGCRRSATRRSSSASPAASTPPTR